MKSIRTLFFSLIFSGLPSFVSPATPTALPSFNDTLKEIEAFYYHPTRAAFLIHFFLNPLAQKAGLTSDYELINKQVKKTPNQEKIIQDEFEALKARYEKLQTTLEKACYLSVASETIFLVASKKPESEQDAWLTKIITTAYEHFNKIKNQFEIHKTATFVRDAFTDAKGKKPNALMLMPFEELLVLPARKREALRAELSGLCLKLNAVAKFGANNGYEAVYNNLIETFSAYGESQEGSQKKPEERLTFFNTCIEEKNAELAKLIELKAPFKTNPTSTAQKGTQQEPPKASHQSSKTPYVYYGAGLSITLVCASFITAIASYNSNNTPVDEEGTIIPFKKYFMTHLKNFNPRTLSGGLKWAALASAGGTGIYYFHSL